jgi:16S rRNA (cytosine967-C5)-methyltransferase
VEVVDDPRRAALLRRAASVGRVRSAALELLAGLAGASARPGAVLAGGMRDARHLHSAERRLVGDGVRALIRRRSVLAATLGRSDHAALWVGWLVSEGLPVDDAVEAMRADGLEPEPARLAALVDVEAATRAAVVGLDPAAALALAHGLSPALARALVASLGDGAEAFLRASAERAPLDLRVNVRRATLDQVRAALDREGVATEPLPFARTGLRVVGRANVVASAAHRAGLVEIQDEGSQILAELVASDGGLVIDQCAGAGGKSLALAAADARATIVAADVRDRALRELRERAARSGARVDTVLLRADGAWPDPARRPIGRADRVLVDAPCSGTGTLRRHPEHLLRLDGPTLAALPGLQSAILDRAAELVRPGGRLIYGTCSVLSAENDEIVDSFLACRPDFVELPVAQVLGEQRAAALGGSRLRVGPPDHATDGFFGAILLRRA